MIHYNDYNREERAICSHLFRLLHEKIDSKEKSPLSQFINILSLTTDGNKLKDLKFENIGIYSEVSIIRDAYKNRKPTINPFMDELTRIVVKQEGLQDIRLYSQLPDILSDPKLTHPKQIKQKADLKKIELSKNEKQVFGAIQGIFNAKPDLAITIDDKLIVIEAKFTEPFDEEQMKRTRKIAEVWTSLLYRDFGFTEQPEYYVFKLGAKKYNPNINWTDILGIARKTYKNEDRTLISFEKGVDLLKQYKLE